jgi:hypothetical protein
MLCQLTPNRCAKSATTHQRAFWNIDMPLALIQLGNANCAEIEIEFAVIIQEAPLKAIRGAVEPYIRN